MRGRTDYAVVGHSHGSSVFLEVRGWLGRSNMRKFPLMAQAPDWATVRAEAAEKFPGRTIVIPKLGEQIPPATLEAA